MEDLENSSEIPEGLGEALGESPEKPDAPTGPVDIDTLDKFRYGGKEYTPKQFKTQYIPQSVYTKKTQEIAEERKYYDNLRYDLASVKQNPNLADQFKSVYPEKYHHYLDVILDKQQAQTNQNAQPEKVQAQQPVDNRFYSEFQQLKQELFEQKVSAAEADLDARIQKYSEKYPYADEEAVLARAQSLIDKNPGEALSDKTWESLFKSVHDRQKAIADQFQSKQVKEQKSLNSKGKDAPSGGGSPGTPPKVARTIKEASRYALQELGDE